MKTIAAGTFDRLHRGHLKFLEAAEKMGDVTIGLTSDSFVERKEKTKSGIILPYEKRRKELRRAGYRTIREIDDSIGFALEKEFEAIVVTKKTRPAAEKINKKRREAGLSPLLIVEVPFVMADDGRPISSSRIRLGIIDREGRVKAVAPRTDSEVRRAMVELIKKEGELYGYQLQKLYEKEVGPISLRLVYYHLARGVKEGLFNCEARVEEEGCSWGGRVERKYYTLAFKPLEQEGESVEERKETDNIIENKKKTP